MKKTGIIILAIFGGIFLLAIAANFLLPMFVSVDDYKSKIQAEFAQATGYSIEFGDIDLALLPTIHASATDVRISNGAKIVAEIAELNAYADPILLIKGDLKVSSVDLQSPKIYLEKYAVGNSWTAPAAANSANSGSSTAFSIDEITIIDGELIYNDAATQKKYQFTKANLTSSFESFLSPISLVGDFEFAKNNFSVDAKITDFEELEIALEGMETQASFVGNANNAEFKISGTDINKTLPLLDEAYKIDLPKPNFVANGSFSVSPNSKLFNLSEIQIGGSRGAGKIALAADGNIIADIKMDEIIVEDFQPKTQRKTEKFIVPDDLKLRLSLQSKQLKYKQLEFSNLDLQSAAEKGEVVLQPLSFNFQDGGSLELFGVYNQPTEAKKTFEGKLQASGKDLRKLLTDYGIDMAKIKTDKFKNFVFDTNLFINSAEFDSIDFSGVRLDLDNSKFSGSSQIIFNETPEISIRGGFSSVNLDDIFVVEEVSTAPADLRQAAKTKITLDFDWLKNLSANLKLAMIFGELTSAERTYENLQFTALANQGRMEVQNFAMRSANTDISGDLKLNVTGTRPNISTNLNIGFIELEPREETAANRWSEAPINLSPLDEIDGDFNINLAGLKQGELRFDNIILSGNLIDSKLNLNNLTSRSFGGDLSLVGSVGVGSIPDFQLKFVGENLDVQQLAFQLAGNSKLSGRLNTSGNLSSSGWNEATLIQELKGTVGFAGTNIIIYGFDLEGFVNKLVNINNPLEVGVMAAKVLSGNGQTLVASMQGNFGINKGVANTDNVNMLTRVGQGLFKGNIDIAKWQMDTNAYFAINLGDLKERPQVGVRMYGAIDNFKKDYDYSEIVSYYSKRFGIGDKIDNVLDKVLLPE